MYNAGGSNGCHPGILRRLWITKCRPLLEYACELWEGCISKEWEEKLESLQNRFCKAALGLTGTPAAVGLRLEMNLCTLKTRRRQLKVRYWAKLCRTDSDRLLSIIFRRRHRETQLGAAQRSVLRAFKQTLTDLGLQQYWQTRAAAKDTWKETTLSRCTLLHEQEEQTRMVSHSTLRLYNKLELQPKG